MNNVLLVIFMSFFSLSFGQSLNEWTLFQTVEGVEFYKKETDCHPVNIPAQTGILIKIVNNNGFPVEAEWDLRIWYSGIEQTANVKDTENHITVNIPKKGSLVGDCQVPNGNLYIFKKFITFSGGETMTNFQFDNLTVHKIR